MNKSPQQIQVFYEIAMSIGKSLNLREMLKSALLAYLRKLNCVAGIVYSLKKSDKSGYHSEFVFSIPYTLNIKKSYPEIGDIFSDFSNKDKLKIFKLGLPQLGVTKSKQHYHVMELGDFGFLVLIKSTKYLDDNVILTLDEINRKLSQACVACINNEALVASEKRLSNNEKYLKIINNFATSILKHNTINEIVWEVIHLVVRDLGFVDCIVYLFDDKREFLVQRAAYGAKQWKGDVVKDPIIIHSGKGIVGTVAKTGFPELIADTSKDSRYIVDDMFRYSELAVPIIADGEVIGVIDTEHPDKNYYTNRHLERLQTVSGLVSSRMKNAISQDKLLSAQVSLTKLSTAIEQSPLSVMITDVEGYIEFVNPAFVETTGYTEIESIGRKTSILKSGEQPQSLYTEMWAKISKGEKWVGELVNKRKNGDKFWVLNSISPIKNSSGDITNYVAMHADISEFKKLESDLTLAKENAEEANKAKSEFLANMSHEIRTPMNAILGFSEALYHKVDSVQHKKMLKAVLSSGNLLLALLNDILDLSKIEAGKLEISPQPLDLRNILQEIELMFSDKAKRKGIKLSLEVSQNLPKILKLDEIRIKQVVFNLIGNAIKFTHKGYVALKASFIRKSETDGELIFEIEDTGIGITKSQQKLIFEAFRQQSGQSNRKYGGAGLGLAITKRLVEKMNGEIKVKSIANKGSVFTVCLPDVKISTSELRRKDVFGRQEEITFEEGNILVVDDVLLNINTIENFLEHTNISVLSAENGEIALEILNHTEPDLILLDIRMPGIDGYEVAKRIKRNTKKKHIPIVAFTASVLSSEKIEKSGNFDGFLYKPVNRNELFFELARFLQHEKGEKERDIETISLVRLTKLPEALINILPEIEHKLEKEFLPYWEKIKDQFVLFRIEEFANNLKKFASLYKFQFLEQYAAKIIEELEVVDLEALSETLSRFPKILDDISVLIRKRNYE